MVSLRVALLLLLAAPADAPADAGTCVTPPQDDPQALVDAALCLAGAGLWEAAARHQQRVVELSTHPLAAASLLRLLRGQQAMARFAEAAALAELYADRYPQEPATPELLQEAARMRLGLGQREQALADLERAGAMLDRRDPARAAELYWSRRDFLLRPGERVAHARTFLERHGKAAALDRRVVAEFTVAQEEWREACEKGLLGDLCLWTGPARALFVSDGYRRPGLWRLREPRKPPPPRPVRCSPERVSVFPRKQARAAEAQRRLAAIVRMAAAGDPGIPADQPQRRREYDDAIGMAALYLADPGLEELLAIEAPDGLSFQVEEWRRDAKDAKSRALYAAQKSRAAASQRRFAEYLRRSQQLGGALEQQYARLADAGQPSPRVKIAALARLGQLGDYRAKRLLAIEVPAELNSEPLVKAFCDVLREQTLGMYGYADQASARCLEISVRSGEFSDFSRQCEDSLQERDPRGYPALGEVMGPRRGQNFGPARPLTRMEAIGLQQDPAPFMSGADDGP